MFHSLKNDIDDLNGFDVAEKASLQRLLTDRWNFMYSDAHSLAHYLDPRYFGIYLDMDTLPDDDNRRKIRDAVEKFIEDYHPAISNNYELVQFKAFMNKKKIKIRIGQMI